MWKKNQGRDITEEVGSYGYCLQYSPCIRVHWRRYVSTEKNSSGTFHFSSVTSHLLPSSSGIYFLTPSTESWVSHAQLSIQTTLPSVLIFRASCTDLRAAMLTWR